MTVAHLCSTRLQDGINPAQGVFIEMFVTSYLVLAVLMLAAEKHQVTPFAPVSLPYQRMPLGCSPPFSLGHCRSGSGSPSLSVNCESFNAFHHRPLLIHSSSWSIYFTGGAVNTARAFGPAVITGFPYGTQWVVCMYSFTAGCSLNISLVLGRPMPGVFPGICVLCNSQAVRFRVNSVFLAARTDNRYTIAGITGS